MTVKAYLKKKNNPQADIQAFLDDIKLKVDTVISERFSALEDRLDKQVANTGADKNVIETMTKNILTNVRGEKGDSIKGETGEKGDSIKGETGEKGDKGAKGDKGERGEKGIDGIRIKEKDGKDGSPDTPKEVAIKLNTLTEKVDIKVLIGFKKIIKQLEEKIFYASRSKSKGGGGGGMGQPQHETFSVSSTTASITTVHNIAAGGRAIFTMRYQGQSLHWGEHYTVSGKVISLLFTPADNSTVDISYIRT